MHFFQLINLVLYFVLAAGVYGDDDKTSWTPNPAPHQPPDVAATPLMAPSENGNPSYINTRPRRRVGNSDKKLRKRSPKRRPAQPVGQKASVTCYRAVGGVLVGKPTSEKASSAVRKSATTQPSARQSQSFAPSSVGAAPARTPHPAPSSKGAVPAKKHPAQSSGICRPQ